MALGLAQAVAEHLRDLGYGALYSTGGNIFVEEEPDNQNAPDDVITVITEPGSPPTETFGERAFTVRVRSQNSEDALTTMHAIFRDLHESQGNAAFTARGIPLLRIRADFNPVPLGRDRTGKTGGLWRYTTTFTAFTRHYDLT